MSISDSAKSVVGLTNSLRQGSCNRMTLDSIGRLMLPAMQLSLIDIDNIPFFELENDPMIAPLTPVLQRIESALRAAIGVAIAVPEYNHSIPGKLKNALDMISRIASKPMEGMPVLIVSASTGRLGGARAQYELRRVLDSMGAVCLIRPEVFIGDAGSKFDINGECTDALTLDFLQSQIAAFSELVASARIERKVGRTKHDA